MDHHKFTSNLDESLHLMYHISNASGHDLITVENWKFDIVWQTTFIIPENYPLLPLSNSARLEGLSYIQG